MGIALIKMKIMPESPNTDLNAIKQKSEKIIKEYKGQNPIFEEEPIAFGLVAIIANFSIDESIPTDPFIEKLQEIKGISSAEIIDFRRAFG